MPGEKGEPQLALLPHDDIASMSPAGAINSSAVDMCRYMQFQLAGGRVGDKRLLSGEQIQQMHQQQMAIVTSPSRLHSPVMGYGMGWFIKPYNGRYMVYHGGNIDGFSANVALLPYEGFGVVILTNKAATGITDTLNYYIIDRLEGWPERDWCGEFLAQYSAAGAANSSAQMSADGDRVLNTKPSHKLEDYAGVYENPGYGEIRISLSKGKLDFTYNKLSAPLEHYHYDIFRIDPHQPIAGGLRLQFGMGLDGRINGLEAQLEPTVAPLKWTRKADTADSAFLDSVVGFYEVAEMTATIARKGDKLTADVPGQQLYDLQYAGEREFTIVQLPGYRVRFPEDGGIELIQPDGIFKGKRVSEKK
jgi:hypothetical protein